MDSVDNKPSFRAAFKARHAVIPVSGYYEWQTTANGKQPYYFQAENSSHYLWLAGLWEPRHALQTDDSDGSFTLITQEAAGIPASVHPRMPIFLAEDEIETWLTLSAGPSMPFLLTRSLPAISVQPVSKRVNTPREDDEGLIAPL
jgi:putative SOS response-associated peptidase YedK